MGKVKINQRIDENDPEPLPTDVACLSSNICHHFTRLLRRHRHAFVKNDRIQELAKPKSILRLHRLKKRCPCFFKKNIEIIHMDQRENTRTEQLAYPKARHLLLFKQQIAQLFANDRICNLNRLIRKSLFSLYSRLGNVQPPMERKPARKWNKSDWKQHTKILKKLAKHKVVKMPPVKPTKQMPLSRMKRYKYLAKPKKYHVMEKGIWALTHEMRRHRASQRTNNLAKPVVRDTAMMYQELPKAIPLRVLKHKASQRISALSKPSARRTGKSISADLRENPFAVSPNALKAKASKRTNDLAEAKEYENKHVRENPYAISKQALKAKAKPRTIALAKPRKR